MVCDARADLGDEAATEMLASCEASLRILLATQHEHESQHEVLAGLSRDLPDETSSDEVLQRFARGMKSKGVGKTRADDDALFAHAPCLKELRRHISGGDGAGPSGGDDLGEDDIQMTQAARTHFKCPLLQAEMTERGPMRPMRSAVCTSAGCVWSHKGITDYLKKATKACPSTGCSSRIAAGDLVEDRDIAKEIRKLAQSR